MPFYRPSLVMQRPPIPLKGGEIHLFFKIFLVALRTCDLAPDLSAA